MPSHRQVRTRNLPLDECLVGMRETLLDEPQMQAQPLSTPTRRLRRLLFLGVPGPVTGIPGMRGSLRQQRAAGRARTIVVCKCLAAAVDNATVPCWLC